MAAVMIVLAGCRRDGTGGPDSAEGELSSMSMTQTEVSQTPEDGGLGAVIAESEALGLSEEQLSSSVLSFESSDRLRRVMDKARRGEDICIGFLGGSVTAGSGAPAGHGYADLAWQWWRDRFPEITVRKINAGIGATNSVIGVHRMQDDLLSRKPDLVVIEYAVNDGVSLHCQETYENVLRRAWDSGAAVLLFFVCKNDGSGAQSVQQAIGWHYGVPMVSVLPGIYAMIAEGHMRWEDYSADTVHPNQRGHAMAAALLKYYFAWVYRDMPEELPPAAEDGLPSPLISDAYQQADLYGASSLPVQQLGSFEPGYDGFASFKNGWISRGTEPMTFTVEGCRRLHLMILRRPQADAGKALVTVNGAASEMDSYFPDGWGSYAEACSVFESDTPTSVTITIQPEDGEKPFILLRVLAA